MNERRKYDFRDAPTEELNEYIEWLNNKKDIHLINYNNYYNELEGYRNQVIDLYNSSMTDEELNKKVAEIQEKQLEANKRWRESREAIALYDRCINRTRIEILERENKKDKKEEKSEEKVETNEPIGLASPVDTLDKTPLKPQEKKEEKQEKPKKEVPKPKTAKDKPDRELPTLESVLLKIISDEDNNIIGLKEGQTRRYAYSNIKVNQAFKDQIRHGNYIYNVTAVLPALAGAFINFCKKASSKLLTRKKTKAKIEQVKENIASLTDDEKETLYRKYLGNNLVNKREFSAVDELIKEEVMKYHDQTHIEPLREELVSLYEKVFDDYNRYLMRGAIINNIKNKCATADELAYIATVYETDNLDEALEALELDRIALMKNKAQEIEKIMSLRDEIITMQSGKGTHSTSEDFKAKKEKYIYKGHKLSKKMSTLLAKGLLDKETEIKEDLRKAFNTNNGKLAMKKFIEFNNLELNNTFEKATILGKVSAGPRHYEPIPTDLDYRQDPLLRNTLVSLAMMGSALSIANNIANMKAANDLKNLDTKIDNPKVDGGISDKDLADLNNQLANKNVADARVYNETAYQMDPGLKKYFEGHVAEDGALHASDRAFYDSMNVRMEDLKHGLESGRLTDGEYLRGMDAIRQESAVHLQEAIDYVDRVLPGYTATHNFDWEPLKANLDSLTNYKNVQDQLVQAAMDGGLTTAKYQALVSGEVAKLNQTLAGLPNSIKTSFIPAATALMLASYDLNSRKFIPKQDKNERVRQMINSAIDEEEYYVSRMKENEAKKAKARVK